jgi:flap endonuclease-1
MAATSDRIWAAASKDYDSLLFGAPRLVRFLTISGKEFLPSQGTFRPIVPETIVLERLLEGWGIDREALVDLAILVGTDFNDGIKGSDRRRRWRSCKRTDASSACRTISGMRLDTPRR